MVMVAAALAGFMVSIGLIAAIGAQNAFVLRQGLRGEHVAAVVAFCALSDAVLIGVGVIGFGALSEGLPWLGQAMRLAGAGFLLVYGALRFRAAWRGGEGLRPADAAPAPLGRVLAVCATLTWANPHVWLDTVALIGSVSTRYAPHGLAFWGGAVLASASFFSALGFGARLLRPLFASARAWVVLEFAVGCIMWALAAALLFGA